MAELDLKSFIQTLQNKIHQYNLNEIDFFYDGNNVSFDSWIKSLNKFFTVNNIKNDQKSLIAYQSSRDFVSNFIQNWLQKNNHANWEELQTNLEKRFGEIKDHCILFNQLREIKQKENEPISHFAQRFQENADICYEKYDINSKLAQTQLIGCFTNGLISDDFKVKIIRKNPETLEDAISILKKEEKVLEILKIRNGKCLNSEIQNGRPYSTSNAEVDGNICSLPDVYGNNRSTPENTENARAPPKITEHLGQQIQRSELPSFHEYGRRRISKRSVRCGFCLKRGHEKRECWKLNKKVLSVDNKIIKSNAPKPKKKPTRLCFFCGSSEHIQANCKDFARLTKSDANSAKAEETKVNLN